MSTNPNVPYDAKTQYEGECEQVVNTGTIRVFQEQPSPPRDPKLRRIQLTQPGFESFSGHFGAIYFENGVSVEVLTQMESDRIAASVTCVEFEGEGDAQLGPQRRLIDNQCLPAPIVDELDSATPEQVAKLNEAAAKAAAAARTVIAFYTEEELQAVVDKKGINGLREISGPLGVKARSIPDLIEAILKAQSIVAASQAAEAKTEVPSEVNPADETNPPDETNPVVVESAEVTAPAVTNPAE